MGAGGPIEKLRHNLVAIGLLKQLEAEERDATASEQDLLVRYCGWGAFPQVFEYRPKEPFASAAIELRALTSEDEWDSLQASTPNAHYTPPEIVSALWAAARRLGVRGSARVLEPALGVGHFFGLQPADLDGPRTGVELDGISARIARRLYPDSAVHQGAFEAQPRLGSYDLVISNVPFGNYGALDGHYGKRSVVTRSIHDYFIGRALDEVRPGGLVAVVTSRYTLDRIQDSFRAWARERASLVGAVRLPAGAFRANAGTDVVADIVILQRRFPGAGHGPDWLTSSSMAAIPTCAINTYFQDHPEQVLGRFELGRGIYGRDELRVTGTLTPEALAAAFERLPADVVPERTGHGRVVALAQPLLPPVGTKIGAYVVRDGALFVAETAALQRVSMARTTAQRVTSMVALRDVALSLIRQQVSGDAGADLVATRAELNRLYDAFRARFGPLSASVNRTAFRTDPDAPLLLSLEERYDRDANTADKAAIFSRRTIEPYLRPQHAETAAEALAVTLAETGHVHWPRLCELLGRSAREAAADLGELVFEDPARGAWVTREQYLSGHVRLKLTQARAACATDAAFQRNVAALEAVQPLDLKPGEIKATLGAAWIPVEDVRLFVQHLFERRDCWGITIEYAAPLATWTVRGDVTSKHAVANQHRWGTERAPALRLLEDALNQRVPTVTDLDPLTERQVPNLQETLAAREKQQELRREFERWAWDDPERATRLARAYNDTFNAFRRRSYDGSHLRFPGMSRAALRDGDLAPHQKDGVWRQLQQRATLLALPVGAGKTYAMIAAAQEARRIGLIRKALFVVPTALVEQWAAEFYRLYPSARVLIGTREHLATGARQQFLARCATTDFDAVIVAHSSFGKLPMRADTQAALLRRELARLEEVLRQTDDAEDGHERARRSMVKDIEKAKRRLEVRIAELTAERSKDRSLCFEDLGLDALFVDEAHYYKNLPLVTKMTRVAGLPTGESERAWDMYAKTRYVLENDGRVVFATGTPVTNTLAEVYTMQRFLQEDTLESMGIVHFDAWAATFAQTVTAVELAPDGSGYRSATRFAAFNNAPELSLLFSQVTELRTEAEMKLPRPRLLGHRPEVVVVPGSEVLRQYVESLGRRADVIRRGGIDARIDNMLKITSDGRKAALDLRELGLEAAPHHARKVTVLAERVHRLWEQHSEARASQVVFCDLSTPKGPEFSFYAALRDELAERGVPESEVAFIHDADSDRAKLELFQALNEGRVRIVLGSTDKLGTGANFQRLLIAAHHVDAPWRPADVEQRNGRILRPGNLHAEVQIFYYVTAGSFDAFMWQSLERKQRFIDQLMQGDVKERSIEDIGGAAALTAAEAKALASGNPEILEVVKLDTEIRRLSALAAHHRDSQRRLGWERHEVNGALQRVSERLAAVDVDLAHARDSWARAGGHSPGLTIAGRHHAGEGYRKPAAAALAQHLLTLERELLRTGTPQLQESLGTYMEFNLRATLRRHQESRGCTVELHLVGRSAHEVTFTGVVSESTIASIEAQVHPKHLEHVAQGLAAEHARCERRRPRCLKTTTSWPSYAVSATLSWAGSSCTKDRKRPWPWTRQRRTMA